MSIRDFIDNIGFARYHICFECKDPFLKGKLIAKMDEYGISYHDGYMDMDGIYSYGVYAVKGGKPKLMEFLAWFKNEHEWKYHYSTHGLFKTRITCLCWV